MPASTQGIIQGEITTMEACSAELPGDRLGTSLNLGSGSCPPSLIWVEALFWGDNCGDLNTQRTSIPQEGEVNDTDGEWRKLNTIPRSDKWVSGEWGLLASLQRQVNRNRWREARESFHFNLMCLDEHLFINLSVIAMMFFAEISLKA